MKCTRFTLIICSLILLSSCAANKSGHELVRDAKDAYYNDHPVKAKRLIRKARKADFGWCGNSVINGYNQLLILEAKMALDQGKYDKCRGYLDQVSTFFSANPDDCYQLYMECLQRELSPPLFGALLPLAIDNAKVSNEFMPVITLHFGADLKMKIGKVNHFHSSRDEFYETGKLGIKLSEKGKKQLSEHLLKLSGI